MASRVRGLAAVLLAVVSAVSCGGARDELPKRPNLVLVSIDSLRADHLGCYGYGRDTSPFLDGLAAEGARFDQAVSTTSWTLPSHAAMFTGLYDSAHGLVDNGRRLAEGHRTLAELLSDNGYHTAGFFGGPYLHPTFGLAQGFDVYRSCMTTTDDDAPGATVRAGASAIRSPSHADITGPRTRREVGAWADAAPPQPYFLFVHLWDVHYDYIPPAAYVRRFDPDYDGPMDGRNVANDPRLRPDMAPRDLAHLVARYDGEIRFTDDVLEGVFADLERNGLLDDTLVLVTSDHGEEFFEHGGKGHQRTLFDEVLRVPLIAWWPGTIASGREVREQVRLIDLLPTLAEAAGVDASMQPAQGRSLLPLLAGKTTPAEPALAELLVGGMTMRALRSPDTKVIRFRDGLRPVMFRLDEDSAERRPLRWKTMGEEGRDLVSRLDEEVRRARELHDRLAAGSEPAQPDPELLRRLRELGYIRE